MYLGTILSSSVCYFKPYYTLSSELLNHQLAFLLQSEKDTYIVAGLYPHVYVDKVVFQYGVAIMLRKLVYIKEKTFDRQWFEDKFKDTTYIYLEYSEPKAVIRFYKDALPNSESRLFLAVWKNKQFFYYDDNANLSRVELGSLAHKYNKSVLFSEKKYNAKNLHEVLVTKSNLPVYKPELQYDIFLNGIALSPFIDYEVQDNKIVFKDYANGVLRIFTYDPIEVD